VDELTRVPTDAELRAVAEANPVRARELLGWLLDPTDSPPPAAWTTRDGGWESGACAAPLDGPDEDAGALLADLNARVERLLAAKRAGGGS